MEFIFSDHAQDQMAKRGIEKLQVIRAIKRGATVKQTDGVLATYTYIKVAYKIRGDKCIIKTIMEK